MCWVYTAEKLLLLDVMLGAVLKLLLWLKFVAPVAKAVMDVVDRMLFVICIYCLLTLLRIVSLTLFPLLIIK